MIRLVIAIVLFTSISTEAQVQRYDLTTTRAALLKVRDGLPAQHLRLTGEPTDANSAFVTLYAFKIHPKLDEIRRLEQRHGALNVLIDTGSYVDQAELKKWKAEYEQATNALAAVRTDAALAADIARWGKLAQGLSGELAVYARRFARENALEHFASDMQATLTEADLLHQEYKTAIRQAKAAEFLTEYRNRSTEIPRLYKSGSLTFAEAQKQITELNERMGGRFIGFEAASARGESLNKMAVLKTKLAQSKGYKTWAEYQLENTGQGYTPEYRGVVNQRKFLHAWISQMRPVMAKFIERRARELKIDPASLRREHISLLSLPDLSLAQPYFPSEKLTDIWEAVTIASGFDPKMLGQIIVDDKERKGLKNPTMAYMAGLVTPVAETRVLDLATLNFLAPEKVMPGLMYIMQTFRGAGLADLRTMFHEGMGHAFEYLLKEKEDMTSEGYGSVEVPSMTAEYFLRDAQMLYDFATPIDGKKPSVEQFAEWVRNHEKNSGLNLLTRASSALYDLDLWDYDYTAPGAKTYLQHAEEVFTANEKLTGLLPLVESEVPAFYSNVATTHFTSGNVRNIGYSYASLGSEMMAQYISRELKKRTGRSSWYRQPGLATLITETWYKVAWKSEFPRNIERITGEKFDMAKILADLTKDLNCDEVL